MAFSEILIFAAFGVFFRLVARNSWKNWLLLGASVLVVFWLQPASPVHYLDFWIPIATLTVVIACWVLVSAPQARFDRQNLSTFALIILLVILVDLTRYLSLTGIITASRPPPFLTALIVSLIAIVAFGLSSKFVNLKPAWFTAGVIVLIVTFIFLKSPQLSVLSSGLIRSIMSQSVVLAAGTDLRWLGFSYIAFRLIHTLRDRQTGKLPEVGLQEFIIYVLFFPTVTAGPIDRLERFLKDLNAPLNLHAEDFILSGQRLASGLFKKFVLADSLALLSLNPLNASQMSSPGWTWVMLYAYSLQIFFDFSGYTDIAIGLGILLGIKLPENFKRPYLQSNLTLFWNNWHITLTQWFRAYFFNPVTRALRKSKLAIPPTLIMLTTQLATMLLIGLWHGITWNFVFWGLWHGIGLFTQNRWSEWVRPRLAFLGQRPYLQKFSLAAGTILTFHYVALGWVWFALPNPALSVGVLLRLFGFSGLFR
jgi:alginate O-acetyltransferase complex protein AlgI